MRPALLAGGALLIASSALARGGGGFSGARSSGFHGSRGSSGGFSRSTSRPSFSGGFTRSAVRSSFGHAAPFSASARPSASRSFGRATFHAAASRTGRRLSGSDSSGSSAPAWATIGAKIVGEGRPPVYSQAAGGGTHSVEGGGFIAMDQSRAQDVGRAPGITWAAPDRAPASSSGGGGGSGGSSNGPAFDPSF
jgi:hypothetical protein